MSSVRETTAARERREWIATEEQRQRDLEDRQQYQKYVLQMKSAQLDPFSFEEWKKLLPEGNNPDIRGAFASNRAASSQLAKLKSERIANAKLDDLELTELGFDLRYRPIYEMELNQAIITDMFRKFNAREPKFDASTQLTPVGEFLWRNRLMLSGPHIACAWELFLSLGIISLKSEPAPEPKRPEGTNEHGVNLGIEPDPEIDAQKRREQYEIKIVVTDPETGKGYTAYQLDHSPDIDSETYRRLMRLPRIFKNPALEPKH